jgi:type I restriction enzyme, S subunit
MSEDNIRNGTQWSTVSLGEIADIKGRIGWKGYTVGDLRDSGILVIGGAHISKEHMLCLSKATFISEEKYEESPEIKVLPGDLLMTKTGTIGNVALVPEWNERATINPNTVIIRATKVCNNFLHFYLSSSIFQEKITDLVTVGAQPSLNQANLRSFLVPLPPLPEQKKIAEILSGIDRCITKLKRRIQKQNLINESILSGMEDLRGNKIARHEATIGDIATKVGSGITPRGGSDTYESEGVTFIRSQNVLKMRLSLGDAVKIPQHIHASMSGTRVQPNDVLLNITGASIGRSAVVPDGTGEANVNQHVCIIRTKEICDPLFLCGWLNSESGQIAINSSQAGGNRQGLNFEQIRAMSIPLPPIHLQKQVSVALQASNSLVQLLQGKLDWLLSIRKALSSDLLSGRKRVSV